MPRSRFTRRAIFGPPASRDYLADAIRFAEALETYHRDPQSGLLAMTAKDAGDVILRLAPTADDAIPNAHPVYLSALVRLAGLTGDTRWLARADALFEALSASVRGNLVAHAGILNALDFRLRAKEIVTVGPKRKRLYEAALGVPFSEPHRDRYRSAGGCAANASGESASGIGGRGRGLRLLRWRLFLAGAR